LPTAGFWIAAPDTAGVGPRDPHARAYQPQISPKWIAPDGRSFWLVWTDFQMIDGEAVYYAFNMQRVDVEVG
jgi:hypothetical protein